MTATTMHGSQTHRTSLRKTRGSKRPIGETSIGRHGKK